MNTEQLQFPVNTKQLQFPVLLFLFILFIKTIFLFSKIIMLLQVAYKSLQISTVIYNTNIKVAQPLPPPPLKYQGYIKTHFIYIALSSNIQCRSQADLPGEGI